jgi:hypothetical protein
MARDRKTIKKELTDAFISDPTIIALYGLVSGQTFEEQFSLVSVENVWFDNISLAIYEHEQIVATNALNSRPHNLSWYLEKCKNFHDGLELVWLDGQFQYDLTSVLDAEERKIIDRVAVLESSDGELVVKVATDNAGNIEPLSAPQLLRFTNYLRLIKDAGNRIRIINQEADKLKLTLDVYVDVSIIDLATGQLLNTDEVVYPVEEAINNYLSNLEFNGAFVKEFLKNEIQKASGVKLPLIQSLEWQYATFPFITIAEWKVPEAGYFKIEPTDLTINYLPYVLD